MSLLTSTHSGMKSVMWTDVTEGGEFVIGISFVIIAEHNYCCECPDFEWSGLVS